MMNTKAALPAVIVIMLAFGIPVAARQVGMNLHTYRQSTCFLGLQYRGMAQYSD
jgi:hypothetical protein